ncbi:hypothetical protein Q4574_11075 [Aliiglaciecola sp. 3_MG-2023]|uniref:hypothetical protein n=1 Tax=Aliiglaciecola sp. 3_MG-2023 TaxID=3062644 RepID=UPI0026E2FD45|nr:hypothetical protein [Aliiglaciecola sp. 3_MG-2023]MDO6693831.1 hypothetical protein [Aliiglaciecola sp. 3_MG-2023]
MHLFFFEDNDQHHPVDESGFNKFGIVLKENIVCFLSKKTVAYRPISELTRFPHEFRRIETDISEQSIETFFLENHQSPDLFHRGFSAIHKGESDYFNNPIKLPVLESKSLLEKNDKWPILCNSIQAGDWLCTFQSKSFMSKIISAVDTGPWSHVAICSGNDTIIEATTEGCVERPLTVYEGKYIHVGLYRGNLTEQEKNESVLRARSTIGSKYNYKGAFIAGMQKFLDKPRYAPTPADLIIFSNVTLVTYV